MFFIPGRFRKGLQGCTGEAGRQNNSKDCQQPFPTMNSNYIISTLSIKDHSANMDFFFFSSSAISGSLYYHIRCKGSILQSPMSGIFLALPEFPFPLLFNSFYLPPGGNQLQGKETEMQHCIRKHYSDYILLMSCQQHLQKWDSS